MAIWLSGTCPAANQVNSTRRSGSSPIQLAGYGLHANTSRCVTVPEFHVPVARVVLILAGESGSFDPELSAKMAGEIRSLRANPPERADMVVFHEDILEHGEIVAAIDQHRRQSN
jgi:hypothetical protein